MRHLIQMMTNTPMLMTIDAHQANLELLKEFYSNPQLFNQDEKTNRIGSLCHLSVFGPTSHRFSGLDESCNQVTCYRDLRAELESLKNNDDIEQIFIEFDGPGGEASGCFDLAQYIAELTKIKPVIGFINGASYSANYALASACSQLYISPHSMGGSIGVIYGRKEIINDKQSVTYFTTGEAKSDGAPLTKLDEPESTRHQEMVNALGEQFFNFIETHRGVKAENVKALQAKVFTASSMLDHGLVDGIKTEEEIKSMMTNARHEKIVSELNAKHEDEKAQLKEQIKDLQAVAEEQGANLSETAKKINNLAKSAGLPEMAGEIIEQGLTEQEAANKLKVAAAAKDEEVSLTSGSDHKKESDFDMQQLIREA